MKVKNVIAADLDLGGFATHWVNVFEVDDRFADLHGETRDADVTDIAMLLLGYSAYDASDLAFESDRGPLATSIKQGYADLYYLTSDLIQYASELMVDDVLAFADGSKLYAPAKVLK